MSINNNISKFANTVDSSGQIDFADLANKPTTLAGYGITDGASGGSVTSYTNASDLPLSGNSAGDLAYVVETNRMYVNTGSGWYSISLVNTDPSITSVQDADSNTTPFTLSTDGTATVITITASDPEEVPVTYSYSVTSGSLTNGGGATATVTQGTGSNTNVFTITPTTTQDYAGSFTLTFTVSDGVNTSTSANVFSLQFTITNSNYTTLLVQADASSSDNQVDASSNSLTITESGNVTSTAFTPYHPKGYSTYFDGSDDSLQVTTSGDLQAIGRSGSECTIEAWVYMMSAPASGTNGTAIYSQGTQGSTGGSNVVSFEIQENSTLRALVNGGYTSLTGCPVSTGTVSTGQWTHLALVLYNNTWTIYINGTADGTGTGSYPSGTTHNTAYIGRIYYGSNRTTEMYIRDLRVTSTAEYTSNFTPTTESLTAVTGTELLTCQDAYIVDNSTNSFDITANNGAATQLFTPYDHDTYSKSSHGGSVYFDGNGDYLGVPDDNGFELSGDFAIELWFNRTSVVAGTYSTLIGGNGSGSNGWTIYITNSNGAISFYHGSFLLTYTEGVVSNTWYHVAVTRSGTALKLFVNGVERASTTNSTTFNQNSANTGTRIGYDINANGYFNGYIQDVRVVNGSAVYTSAFTPPTSPLTAITNTQLLTCTNKHDVWDAASGSLITPYGTPEASTTQYKWSNSLYLASEDISFPNNGRFDFNNTEDFTVEFWSYIPSFSGTYNAIASTYANGSAGWAIQVGSSGQIYINFSGDGVDLSGSSGSVSTSTWHHWALVGNSGTWTLYIDGTSVTSSSSITHGSAGTDLHLGSLASSYNFVTQYIEDFRFTRGLARYTSNFTAPSAAFEG